VYLALSNSPIKIIHSHNGTHAGTSPRLILTVLQKRLARIFLGLCLYRI
jgi:hypothetical protein